MDSVDYGDQRKVEKVFAEFGQVRVTNARFIVPNETYALSGLTSIKFQQTPPDVKAACWMTFIGFLISIAGYSGSNVAFGIFGVILLLCGVSAYLKAQPDYFVVLRTSSGEQRAYRSKNKVEVENIITALNEAIVHQST